MNFKSINTFFPFRNLLKLVLGMAIIYQILIIVYNHFSGFYPLESGLAFLLRFLKGITYSTIAGILIAIPDIHIIKFLNRYFQWDKKVIKRVSIQLFFTVVIAILVSAPLTLLNHLITPYPMGLWSIVLINIFIYSIINLITMILLEAWLFFTESNLAKQKAETLEKELSQIRFEVLKSQINPHFMFNSLNVLSGLVEKDLDKAQQFIEEFSHIYRYVLESIDKHVVTLYEEMNFVRSYFFLQQIRYGDALSLYVNIPSLIMQRLMPPLSLQVVLENAIKHNIVETKKPLQIEIYYENGWLLVRNNIQLKISAIISTGLGQTNLVKRYALIGGDIPQFNVETKSYLVKLPLIYNEHDESINN